MKGVPRLARGLLRLAVAAEDREYVLRDLEERYAERVANRGVGSARRWYWWQVVRGVLSYFSLRREDVTSRAGRATLGLDVRAALRTFRRQPLYATGVVGTLGLGLAAVAAVFAIAHGIWLRPLPVPDSDRLVSLYELNLRESEGVDGVLLTREVAAANPSRWNRLSPPFLSDLQAMDLATVEAAGAITAGTFDWMQGTESRRLTGQMVSPAVFRILSVRPLAGRLPAAGPGVREVALDRDFWESAFGADPSVIGTTLDLNGEFWLVTGVVDPPALYSGARELWVPLEFEAAMLSSGMRGARYLDVIAKLRPGRTPMDAAAELDAVVKRLAEQHPNHRGWGAHVLSLRADLARPFRNVLTVLLAAGVAFALLAIVNVAGLVAARRAEGRHSRAVRLALGASQRQLLRGSIVESTMLGGLAAAVAGVCAVLVIAPVRRLIPASVPRLSEAGIGPGLLAVLLLTGLLAGALIGLLGHIMSGVRDAPAVGRNRDERPSVRGRRVLLVTQVALTTWLLVSGVALIRYVQGLRSTDVGFRAAGAFTSPVGLSPQRQGSSAERRMLFWNQLLESLQARGVASAIGTNVPISGSSMRYGYALEGESSKFWGQYHQVSEAYFQVLGIDIIAGRPFNAQDGAGAEPVVIINEAMARQHFGGEDPVGRTITVLGPRRTIVGVARSTRHFGPDAEPPAEFYVPLAQDPPQFAHVLVRSGGVLPANLLGEVMRTVDPLLYVPPLTPFTDHIRTWFAPLRLQLLVLGLFAAVAALLAALGVYALVSYVVASRSREIGIRVALGEELGQVFRGVMRQGLLMAVFGATAGVAAALATSGLTRSLVSGVDPADPIVVAVVSALIVAIATLGSAVPALRALRVDPMVAFRME